MLEAGLTPSPLGPPWLGSVGAEVNAVLVNGVGASGEDGERTLALLESRAWRVDWVVADEDVAAHPSADHIPELRRWDEGWYALLDVVSRTPRHRASQLFSYLFHGIIGGCIKQIAHKPMPMG